MTKQFESTLQAVDRFENTLNFMYDLPEDKSDWPHIGIVTATCDSPEETERLMTLLLKELDPTRISRD